MRCNKDNLPWTVASATKNIVVPEVVTKSNAATLALLTPLTDPVQQ